MPNSNPWEGKPIEDTNIVRRMKNAIDDPQGCFKRADNLKMLINGGKWSDIEKEELSQAMSDYSDMQLEKHEIDTSVNTIDSLFDEKSQQLITLSADAQNIESKLSLINNHLEAYQKKIAVLHEKNPLTEEELEWIKKADTQIERLQNEKNNLSYALSEIQVLKNTLNTAEQTVTSKLEDLLTNSASHPLSEREGKQSATGVINQKMAELRSEAFSIGKHIHGICSAASKSFKQVFSDITTLSSQIKELFKTADATLDESSQLLEQCPATSTNHPKI